VFSKFVKLYPLKAATTKARLNKILNDYVVNLTRPKCILSESGTQFASKIWKNKLADMKIEVMFSPIRHPQASPSNRCMREFGKFCLSTSVKNINDSQNCYCTLKSGSTEHCPIQLATAC